MNEKNLGVDNKLRCISEVTSKSWSELIANSDINLRLMKPQEVPVVGTLIRDTIRVSYAFVYPPRAIEFFLNYHTDDSIARRYESGMVIIAERSCIIVATGPLVGKEITGVFVSAEYQRKNIGKGALPVC